mmetsp:Transcript_21997/g.39258  ORF Transcript_21997/g.39258 Transcript_21997/m.39258 type:complete len:209 (-) Transcript_21997:212-838(-)
MAIHCTRDFLHRIIGRRGHALQHIVVGWRCITSATHGRYPLAEILGIAEVERLATFDQHADKRTIRGLLALRIHRRHGLLPKEKSDVGRARGPGHRRLGGNAHLVGHLLVTSFYVIPQVSGVDGRHIDPTQVALRAQLIFHELLWLKELPNVRDVTPSGNRLWRVRFLLLLLPPLLLLLCLVGRGRVRFGRPLLLLLCMGDTRRRALL